MATQWGRPWLRSGLQFFFFIFFLLLAHIATALQSTYSNMQYAYKWNTLLRHDEV